jgi:hypothetical protein
LAGDPWASGLWASITPDRCVWVVQGTVIRRGSTVALAALAGLRAMRITYEKERRAARRGAAWHTTC